MPIHECKLPDGGNGYQWGNHGKCFADRKEAEKQAEAAYSNGYAGDSMRFALDSARHVDADGRLHVAMANISKAMVSPYLGSEIPNYAALGLAHDRIYQLLRDPDELAKAAPTFNNIQLLIKHVPVSADDPKKDLVVGSSGTDAKFESPYLKNSLVIWDAEAIAGIEEKVQQELSCSYRYVPIMTPGTFEGIAYDGVMTEIAANHIALVESGRCGPDVMVSDSNPFLNMEQIMTKASSKTIAVRAALGAYLRPVLAADSKLNIHELIGAVKTATIAADAKRISKAVIAKATFAQDAKVKDSDIEDVVKEAAEEGADDEEEETEEEKKKREAKEKADKADDEDDEPKKPEKKDDGKAMDAAIKLAQDSIILRMRDIHQAEKDVHHLIGDVVAQDSAEAVYKLALDHLHIDTTGVHPSAYAAIVKIAGAQKSKTTTIAQDSANASGFWSNFKGIQLPGQA